MTAFQRLTDLMIYMCDEEFQATLPNLARAMGVYEQQIKQDIEYLRSYEAPKGNLLFAPHIWLDNEHCYHMDRKVLSPQGKLLSMTSSQLALYKYAIYSEFDRWQHADCDYPDIIDINIVSNQPSHNFDTAHLLTIEKAIQMGASIKLSISTMISTSTMTPHFIKRDVNTGVLYVIETFEDNYIAAVPLHEINYVDIVYLDTYSKKITPTGINSDNIHASYINNNNNTKSNRITISEETTTRVDSIWSFDEETLDSVIDDEPTHIKLMIFEDNADIIENIKMDTYGRSSANLNGPFPYEEKNHITTNVYYYEDDVLGLEPFKSWVKKLGASALVLEPKDMAYEIYRELQSK